MDTQLVMPIDRFEQERIVTFRIQLGFLPPSKNVIDNWPPMYKSGAKKKWVRHVSEQCAAQQVPTGLHKVGLAAKLVFASRARRDPQNYAQALWHWVPDALVRCGVLVDDAAGNIEIGPNWGITMEADLRRDVPKEYRQKTILTLAIER